MVRMSMYLAPVLVAILGLAIAHFLSRAPELQPMRLSQLILVPSLLVFAFCFPINFITYIAAFSLIGLLLAPNIAFYCGQSLWDFLDPKDWVPLEAEIELGQVLRMIEKDRYQEALEELDQLLKAHKPTYEALLLKSKLLHHFGSVDETMSVLCQMINLCRDDTQHVAVMEAIHLIEKQYQAPRRMITGVREIRIYSELMVFPVETNDRSVHKIIPPGSYRVEGFYQGDRQWFKLVGEDWGNATICWEAVDTRKEAEESRRHILGMIAEMHRMIGKRLSWPVRVSRPSAKDNPPPRQTDGFQISPMFSEITPK